LNVYKLTTAALAAAAFTAAAMAQTASQAPARQASGRQPLQPCQSVIADPPVRIVLGKSQMVRLPFPVARMVVGGPTSGRSGTAAPAPVPNPAGGAAPAPATTGSDGVADSDVILASPTELYLLARRAGSMNVVLQGNDGRCLVKDIVVTLDPNSLQSALADVMPKETGVRVRATEGGLVLTGTVSDAVALDDIMSIAGPYGGDNRKIVNLLRVTAPQQVMLEVTIAEVSKKIIDHMDLDFTRMLTNADGSVSRIFSGIFGGGAAAFGRFAQNVAGGGINNSAVGATTGATAAATSNLSSISRGSTLFGIDAQQRDGLVRVLAEPNIMAISGQSASFLSGGKIFIPVAQTQNGTAGTVITLEEKEFGVGLKFTPTVLDGSRINLKFVSEASELQQTGTPFTSANGVTAILPSMATRRVDTTVQLMEGQSFMVAGLIKNNVAGALNKFPGLGEAPVVGALFRSSEFQNDQTELMFIVTPRLVKPLLVPVTLPTDNHIAPTRGDVLFKGREEGAAPATPVTPAKP
jgi:pilus assembly protein CpaC